jgi:hypothetical protein
MAMTKQEQQGLAKSLVKELRLMRIDRDLKLRIYYSLVSGLAIADGFNEDYLLGFDSLLDQALRSHKQRNKDKLILR